LWVKRYPDPKNYGYWESSDDSRRAIYELRTHILLFSTKEYDAKINSEKAASEKATLKGF
jgi:hypothetical protein